MKTVSISDITQEEFDDAVQLVISGIKASDPKLDTRVGTVLRSLLVNPEARMDAVNSKQTEIVRKSTSLKELEKASKDGDDIDPDDVNSILTNFNVTSSEGTRSEGTVKIVVADGSQSYTVSSGSAFNTVDGLRFISSSTITAILPGNSKKTTQNANATLYRGSSGYFFLVPVKAESVGIEYNIQQGTSMVPEGSIYTLVSAEAYKSFNGGSDVADIGETIDKIPSGLSIRGFVNRNACEGMLRDQFDSGNYPVVACSSVGYGDSAQRRDKHNLFGVGVGGRIDLYVRNFGDLYTITKTVTGHKLPTSSEDSVSYSINVTPDDFPGSCWIKDVNLPGEVNSPLDFECVRVAYGIDKTWHDIDVRKNSSEAFNTVWQGFKITALEVPPGSDSSDSSEEWAEERSFQVCAYCLPQAKELQEYVDREDIRSVSTDVLVRCPIICNVSVLASVVYDVDNPMDVEDARYKIRKYINSLGFVKSLTRSEIVHILKSCGAVSVDLGTKNMLKGVLHDAFGTRYELSGDSLNLDGLADDSAMLSSSTAIFAAEPENIQITMTPNE